MEKLRRIIRELVRERIENIEELGQDAYDEIERLHPDQRIIVSHDENIEFRQKGGQRTTYKPNGLWYGFGNSWMDWVRSEMPDWESERKYDHAHLLEIVEGSVLKMSTHDQLLEFTERYRGKQEGYFEQNMIDWTRVAEDYAGIEINPYIESARMDEDTNWYYTWDIASGCIWDKSAIRSITRIS